MPFSSITTRDRLTATLCATDRLTAILWEKTSPGVVPHSKERRRGTARLCRKNLPIYERSHMQFHNYNCSTRQAVQVRLPESCRLSPLQPIEDQSQGWGIDCHLGT